jgi:DNA-binding transcriptional ArsR family regulator
MTKTKTRSSIAEVSDLLQVISPEAHLEILLAIGKGEACVCHLESRLGYRQAYISQHLMALREAGLLSTRRDGKYIFYRLEKPEIMEMVDLAARMAGLDVSTLAAKASHSHTPCDCPKCSTQKE